MQKRYFLSCQSLHLRCKSFFLTQSVTLDSRSLVKAHHVVLQTRNHMLREFSEDDSENELTGKQSIQTPAAPRCLSQSYQNPSHSHRLGDIDSRSPRNYCSAYATKISISSREETTWPSSSCTRVTRIPIHEKTQISSSFGQTDTENIV